MINIGFFPRMRLRVPGFFPDNENSRSDPLLQNIKSNVIKTRGYYITRLLSALENLFSNADRERNEMD